MNHAKAENVPNGINKLPKPKVDSILESVCLPLGEDEFELLEKQIIRDGCQDALKVWDRDGELILLDGHNRLKICNRHDLPYDTSTIEIESIDEAIVWIVDNQRGRRNVATKEQLDYISGKRYEAQKNINRLRDEKGVFKSSAPSRTFNEMDKIPHNKNFTAYEQAKKEGTSSRTIEKNAYYAKGIDAVKEVAPEMADTILRPKPEERKLSKGDVAIIPKIPKEELREAVNKGIDGLKEATEKAKAEAKEKKDRDRFQKMHEELQEKHDAEVARVEKQYGKDFQKLGRVCTIERGNTLEYWCNDCLNGFDTFTGGLKTKYCPYCGKQNIRIRNPDWIYGNIGGDD